MKVIALYITTILIWGTTWVAIAKQLGVVPVACSVTYRFVLCYALLYLFCIFKKVSLQFPFKMHLLFAGVGLGIFCLNYILFYSSTQYIASGLVCVIFSTISIFNTILAAIFLDKKLSLRHFQGIFLGILGITILFYPDIKQSQFDFRLIKGVSYTLLGTLLASIAQTLIAKGLQKGVSILPIMTLSMGYGALFNLLIVIFFVPHFVFDMSASYIISLAYLALAGTIASFACYFALIKLIGPEKSAYSATLYPAIALVLSTFFEGYSWSFLGLFGFALILWGNVFILSSKGAIRTVLKRRT